MTPSNAVSVLNLQVDSNTYQPVTSKTLSGYWGYFITTLTQDCSKSGGSATARPARSPGRRSKGTLLQRTTGHLVAGKPATGAAV